MFCGWKRVALMLSGKISGVKMRGYAQGKIGMKMQRHYKRKISDGSWKGKSGVEPIQKNSRGRMREYKKKRMLR